MFTRNHICIIKKSVFHVPEYYQNCHKFTRKYCAIYEVPQITRQNKNYKKNLRSLKENSAKSYLRTEPKHKFKRHCPRKRIDNR